MIYNTIKDPDLEAASKELEAEFPSIEYDDFLKDYKRELEKKAYGFNLLKKIIIKIIFHGIFYAAFTVGLYFILKKYNMRIFDSMIYGLTYFLIYFIIRFKIDDYLTLRKLKWRNHE